MKKALTHYNSTVRLPSTSRVSAKYQVVIPKATRVKLGIKPGDLVNVVPSGKGAAVIKKRSKDIVDEMYGIGAGMWDVFGGVDAYIEAERNSWDD